MKKVVDPDFLACDHHLYMSIGVSAVINPTESDECMIVGLGGGCLCTFLYNYFAKVRIYCFKVITDTVKNVSKIFDGIRYYIFTVENCCG